MIRKIPMLRIAKSLTNLGSRFCFRTISKTLPCLNFKNTCNFSSATVNKPSTQIKYFQTINLEILKEVHASAEYLISLPKNILKDSIDIFLADFFPPENQTKIISNLMALLKDEKIQSSSTATSFIPPTPFEVLKRLKTIVEFLDKSNRGLLLGDLSQESIVSVKESVGLALEQMKFDESEINEDFFNKSINEIYDKICNTCFNNTLFKLPVHGISYPQFENPRNLFERQLILEDESNEMAIEKFLSMYEDLQNFGLSYNLQFARKYIVEWFPNLTKAIKDEQDLCMTGDAKGDRKFYGSYLVKVSSEKLSLLALTELMKNILKITSSHRDSDLEDNYTTDNPYYVVCKNLFEGIGRSINAQLIFDYEEEVLKSNEKERLKMSQKQDEGAEGEEAAVQKKTAYKQKQKPHIAMNLLKKKFSYDNFMNLGIPSDIQMKLGSLLVYFMKETIKIKNEYGLYISLLSTGYVRLKPNIHRYLGVLNVNENFIISLLSKIDKTNSLFVQLDRSLPMIYKCAPWNDHDIGGYYQKPTNIMRMHESSLQEESIKYADLHKIYNVLDLLGETPWRINKKVLKVVEQLWDLGGGVGEIPKKFYDFKDYIYQYQFKETAGKDRYKLMKKLQQQRDMHSLKCDFTLKLNVAKGFADVARIYFPHNLDFRGRVYPVPPHLNHIGADISRGLLEFADSKPIGKNGIQWLKIHLANKMGKDKMSFPDRIAYVDSILGVVENCVADPIKNQEWLAAEDCWQTLAAMYDLIGALKAPRSEEYLSNLHIHQDGSCNGLQHYAALGRDIEGAQQVNLVNREKPGDIYTHVANMVHDKVIRDSEDPDCKFFRIAQKLKGNIKRKTVKQTVMTSVYGVTFIGARKQIYKQLKDKEFFDQDDRDVYEASYYIAVLTLDAIKDLFKGAHDIKKWLIECAGIIAAGKNPVSWITPLGLPVVQPYRSKSQLDTITTVIQKIMVSDDNDQLPVNKMKQRSAFPPNFIHSLDSTHLMYTVMECKQEDIAFAAVHDSYWTHACTVDRMNEILREQFVKLHSQPLLEGLKNSFEIRFPDEKFPEIPNRGKFNLEQVIESRYFFA